MTSAPDVSRVYDVAEQLDTCMFVTRRGEMLTARPMSSIVQRGTGHIQFLTSTEGSLADDVSNNPNVVLAYGNGSNLFLSVGGTATVSADRTPIGAVWNPGAQAFWPDGPDDPKVRLVTVQLHNGELWDGDNSAVAAVKFAFALATGRRADVGERKSVDLSIVR
ncbi:MAG: pyridoxamine 5'-phosphate oxidase family protein [Hyphomicrobium aestuarii]|nr:pyridoxamine 5'-phosphate oxidase family protein [Hyphomicrobium aestuarii]